MIKKISEQSLTEKIEHHLATQKAKSEAVRVWDEKRQVEDINPVIYIEALVATSREDELARLSIVMHQPADGEESDRKLEYLAAYIIATRAALDPKEIEIIKEMTDKLSR